MADMMQTQETKFVWPFIQCISEKPPLELQEDGRMLDEEKGKVTEMFNFIKPHTAVKLISTMYSLTSISKPQALQVRGFC